MTTRAVLIGIAAAGAGTRMRGGDKTLEMVGGEPLLRRLARAAEATGWPAAVTLGPDHGDRAAVLSGLSVDRLTVPDAAEGMAASLRALADHAGSRGLCLTLADLPQIDRPDLSAAIDTFGRAPDRVLRAVDADGRAGHPVVFPARLMRALRELSGDTGARDVLRDEDVATIEIAGATVDLDTPEAWAAWRAR